MEPPRTFHSEFLQENEILHISWQKQNTTHRRLSTIRGGGNYSYHVRPSLTTPHLLTYVPTVRHSLASSFDTLPRSTPSPQHPAPPTPVAVEGLVGAEGVDDTRPCRDRVMEPTRSAAAQQDRVSPACNATEPLSEVGEEQFHITPRRPSSHTRHAPAGRMRRRWDRGGSCGPGAATACIDLLPAASPPG